MKTKLKSDKYRTARGGYSRLLRVSCGVCGEHISTYQKDGHGNFFKRMYLDRIVAPEELAALKNVPLKKIPNLVCPKCKLVLAVPYVYEKEDRLAYRLFVGAVTKKIINKKEA